MQKLSINGSEVLRIKLRLDDIIESIALNFTNLSNELTNCSNNLRDNNNTNSVVMPVENLINRSNIIKDNMVNDLKVLSEFMASQVQEYSI